LALRQLDRDSTGINLIFTDYRHRITLLYYQEFWARV